MSINIFELRQEHKEQLDKAEALLGSKDHVMTTAENEQYDAAVARADALAKQIHAREQMSTIRANFPNGMPGIKQDGEPGEDFAQPSGILVPQEHHKASALRISFGAWARKTVGSLTGAGTPPAMEATAASGIIGIGSETGTDSIGFAIATQILPFLRSYLQFAPFEKVGSSIISTNHMRPINLPVVAAGATPSTFVESQGPAQNASGSQPFGLSGFTFGATKFARQVIASWESLQSTEVPLDGMILDELVTSVANAVTQSATAKLFAALTAPPNVTITGGALAPLQVGGSTVTADAYGQLMALRNSLPDGLEGPECAFMLSRSTLSVIRNSRATTSGVPMFTPESDQIFGRPYVTNEYFDSICGAGFVAYGNWNKGAWLRKTPLLTRPLLELYWTQGDIGFIAQTWTDAHFLAELVGAAQPPTWQPLYFTVLPSGLLS